MLPLNSKIGHSHSQISFNNVPVSRANFQKHLGICLDEKLNLNHHIKENMTKAIKEIGVIEILSYLGSLV